MAPLSGLKVVELARILAGPWIGQTLADLGAGDDAEPHLQALEDVIADAEDRAPDEA